MPRIHKHTSADGRTGGAAGPDADGRTDSASGPDAGVADSRGFGAADGRAPRAADASVSRAADGHGVAGTAGARGRTAGADNHNASDGTAEDARDTSGIDHAALHETKWRTRAFEAWAIVGACVLVYIVLRVGGIIWQAVATTVVTALTVFLLHGTVDRLESKGIPRLWGTLITFVVVTLAIAACLFAFIPAIVQQLSALVSALPGYTDQLQDTLRGAMAALGTSDSTLYNLVGDMSTYVTTQAADIVSGLAGGVVGGIVSVSTVLAIGAISLICSFWILLDLPKIVEELNKLIPEEYGDGFNTVVEAFDVAVYGWARSTLVCAIINGVACSIGFMICGVPYFGVLGLLSGILYFVPYLGVIVTAIIVGIIGLTVSPLVGLLAVVLCVVIHALISNLISPRLMKDSVNVHPAIVLIAILVGGALGGVAGMLLSIPVVATIQGVFVTFYEARTHKQLATTDGALFQKKPEMVIPTPRKRKKPESADA